MQDLSGQSFGRYHIVKPLGEGGMALVYKAYDTRLERDVALKVIRTEKATDELFLKRFEREARALAQLNHPNIVHINDYGEQDGVPYLVMDYLPGGTLKDLIQEPMEYRQAARLLLPIANALGFAHSKNILHRDVKPGNILIPDSGEPLLTDFGIARILETDETADLTATNMSLGTPSYMAPEQTGRSVDQRADVYALGVVFYEMLTGRTPYRADTPLATLMMHASDPLPDPKKFVVNLPDQVVNVLIKALQKKPDDRYQSMAEFARALEKLAAESKTGSNSDSIAPPILQKGAWQRWALGGLAFFAIAAVMIWNLTNQQNTLLEENNADLSSVSKKTEVSNAVDMARTEIATATPFRTISPSSISTITPEATFTPTLIATTESGLTYYDNFIEGHYFQVDEKTLLFTRSLGEVLPSINTVDAKDRWVIADFGTDRLSVESKIMVGASIAQYPDGYTIGISLIGPGTLVMDLGYGYDLDFHYSCMVYYRDSQIQTHLYDKRSGRPSFDKYQTFRISIEEVNNSADLAISGYIDDELFCTYIPPQDWQEVINQDGRNTFYLNAYVPGETWLGQEPLLITYADVAAGQLDLDK